MIPEDKFPMLMSEASLDAPGIPRLCGSQVLLPTDLDVCSSSPLSPCSSSRAGGPLLGVLLLLLLALPCPGVLLLLGLPPLLCRSCRRLLRLGGRLKLAAKGRGSLGDLPVYPRRPHPLVLAVVLVLVWVLGLLLPLRTPLAVRSLVLPTPWPLPWRRGVRTRPSLCPCSAPLWPLAYRDEMGPE